MIAGRYTYLQVLNAESHVHEQKKILIDLDAHALELDANLVRALGLADYSRWSMT